MNSYSGFLFTLLSLVALSQSKSLPSYIKRCDRKDPNIGLCLKNIFFDLKPRLGNGIRELNIPPLNPFFLPSLILNQGTPSVNFKAEFRNVSCYGATEFIINNVRVNFENPEIFADITLPRTNVIGDYDISGKILVVPIKGSGKIRGNFTDINSKITLTGKYVKKNKKTYLKIEKQKVEIVLGGLQIRFSNLFNGNKELTDSTNMFINENWRDILEEIKPLVEETAEGILIGVIKGIIETFSMEELYSNF